MLHTLTHKNKLFIFAGLMVSILLFALDNMIVAPALPQVISEINGDKYFNYVFTAYLLTQTIITPIYGKLSDIYSRKRMIIIAILIFLISSVLCGLSQNIFELIAARAMQGIGGGAIFVTSMSMIGELFTLEERAKYQGYIGVMFGIASVAGPLLGAVITASLSWRYIFLVNVPVGIVSLYLLYRYLPETITQDKKSKVDYIGSFLLVSMLTPFILMFNFVNGTNIVNTYSVLLFAFAAIVFVIFYQYEKSIESPIFSHSLFRDRKFAIPASLTFLNAIILFSATIYLQLLLQKVYDMDIRSSGLSICAMLFPMLATSILSSRYVGRTKKYRNVVVYGSLILLLSLVNFSFLLSLTEHNYIYILLALIPIGIGMGTMMSVFNIIIQSVYGRERLGEVTGAMQLVRGLGGVIGTAVLGFIYNYAIEAKTVTPTTSNSLLISHAIYYVFAFVSVLAIIGFIISLQLREEKLVNG